MERWHSSVMMKSNSSIGKFGLYLHGLRRAPGRRHVETGSLLRFRVQLLTLQHGVDPLDGGDAHPAHRIDAVGLQELNVVELGEFAPVAGHGEPLELPVRLSSQVAAVHEEQHPPCARVPDEAIDLVAGHKRLAAAGGHLHQGTRAGLGQRLLQVADGLSLHGPET